MAVSPVLGLVVTVLSAPVQAVSDTPRPLAFDLASLPQRSVASDKPFAVLSEPAIDDAVPPAQFRWSPIPAALVKVDPAGVRVNMRF